MGQTLVYRVSNIDRINLKRPLDAGLLLTYAEFEACVTTNCSEDCPGQGGNACMNCEVENCRVAYMACSGLDFVPPNVLTLPL